MEPRFLFVVEMGQYELEEPVEVTLHVIASGIEAAAAVCRKWIEMSAAAAGDPDSCMDIISIEYLADHILISGDIAAAAILFDVDEEGKV